MNVINTMREQMKTALERAKKADRLTKSATRRLSKFSIFYRVVCFKKFSKLRAFIEKQKWERFACTSVALHLSRSIKFQERRAKQRSRK